jgi:sulfite reductase beta subunit-like hemoprotein
MRPLDEVSSSEMRVAEEGSLEMCPAEILRQWSTLHAEFSFIPRKFKLKRQPV